MKFGRVEGLCVALAGDEPLVRVTVYLETDMGIDIVREIEVEPEPRDDGIPDLWWEADQWTQETIATILDGAFLATQAALPHLKRAGGGSIVNIGGLTGHKGALHRAHVITAKAGLAGMTKALALDFAEFGITVNCVVPGTIETQRGLPGAPERPAYRNTVPPIGRRGTPQELAAVVRMLCGPEGRYITGQSIHVNGGGWMP